MNNYVTKKEVVDLSKMKQYKRKPMWPFAFFLLPTILVLFYGAIVGLGILPHSFIMNLDFIGLGSYRVRFLGLFDDYMVIVSFISLLVLPMTTVLCMIIRASGNSSRAAALEEAEHRQQLESLYHENDVDLNKPEIEVTDVKVDHVPDTPTMSGVTVAAASLPIVTSMPRTVSDESGFSSKIGGFSSSISIT